MQTIIIIVDFFLLKNEAVGKKYATVVQTIQLRNRYTERISNR